MIAFGWPQLVVAAVGLQRLAELVHSRRNTRALLARGAVEQGGRHYPAIVLLHTAWLLALFLLANPAADPGWPWLILFAACQGLRIWALATLGPYWTTRIIVLPGAPEVTGGPYRFLRHPNYLVVAIEIPALALGLGLPGVALVFGVTNACVLALRIVVEDAARAALPASAPPNP